MTEIRCYKCNEYKPTDQFTLTRKKKVGPRGMYSGYCRPCFRAYDRARYKLNPVKRDNSNPRARLKLLLKTNFADRSELDFDWAWNKLEKQEFKCEITGHPFEWVGRSPYGLSMDRIDPNKGYTKDNVRLVCWWINAAMGRWGLEKLKGMIIEWQQKKSLDFAQG